MLALTAATSVGVGSTIVAGTDAVGLAVSSVTSGIASMAAAVVGGLETAYLAAQSLCTMHSSNATNLCKFRAILIIPYANRILLQLDTTFAPAIIAMVEKEVGGLSAVQKELLAILSSPSIESDVRNSALSILARLNEAAAVDAAGGELKTIESAPEPLSPPAPSIETPSFPLSRRPSKRVPSSVSTLLNRIIPEANQERKTANIAAKQSKLAAKKAAKEEELARKDAASWEDVTIEDDVASGKILAVNSAAEHKRVVVYGLVMNEQRHFEVREEEGRLLLVDGHTKSVISKVS